MERGGGGYNVQVNMNRTYHADPDKPTLYMTMSETFDSTRPLITPQNAVIARKPPPEPITPIVGT